MSRLVTRLTVSDQTNYFAGMMGCLLSTLLVGCCAAARTPRVLTDTNCFDLSSAYNATSIVSKSMVFHMMISAFQQARVLGLRSPSPLASIFNTKQVFTIIEQSRYKTDCVRSSPLVFWHDEVCIVYARWVATPPRALLVRQRVLIFACFGIECIDCSTPIITSSMVFRVMISAFEQA